MSQQRICYGINRDANGNFFINENEAITIRIIFGLYLEGSSLIGICTKLNDRGIPSPSGRGKWGQQVLANILSNERYSGEIINSNIFKQTQTEKQRRSNQQKDENGVVSRANTKYNSGTPLSGRIICAECGRPYRRITRTNHDESKEIVWRCASRIEHGSKICKYSPTISESEVIRLICNQLNLDIFDESQVRQRIDRIEILVDAPPTIYQKGQKCVQEHEMSLFL